MRRTAREPHRRGRTRWLMVTPITGLVIIIVGIIVLEAMGPRPGPLPGPIDDLPPMAVHDEPRQCTRDDETTINEIRSEHSAASGRVGSAQIYACPEAFDHLGVVYVGEVVGEVLRRSNGAWAQVNDDDYALQVGPLVGHREHNGFNTGISVWLPDDLHEMIGDVGRPARRGDVLLIDGTVLRTDPLDGGGTTIRADSVEILQPSVAVDDPLHVPQAVAAGLLAMLAVAALIWGRRAT